MRKVFLNLALLFVTSLFSQSVNISAVFPEDGSYLQQSDCFIALSFLDSASNPIESAVLENGIKLSINEIPVAAESITIENGVAVFKNISLKEGLQKLKVELLDKNGNVLGRSAMNFTIMPPEKEKSADKEKRFKQNGRVFTSTTHNALAGEVSYDFDLGAAYRARYNKWHTSADLYITSKESEKDQPRNIYTVGFGYGKNLELKLGDVAPSLNYLSINGQRIRGIELNTAFYSKIGNKVFSLDAAYGEAVRAVAPYEIAGNDSVFGKGTFARSLFCARLATGAGEAFQFGLLFVKGRDDTSSIHKSEKDTVTGSPYFASYKPKDNVVIGADLSSIFFKERIELFGTYALSLYSRDISDGMLTKAELEKALDSAELPFDPSSLGSFLIFNTSTTPISPYGEGIMNSSALEGGIRLRFSGSTFTQNLEVKYQDIGPNYFSAAAPLLGFSRTGIIITEQLALFQNHISLNGSYENFVNGAGSGLSQTKENGLNMGLSLWHSSKIPTLSLGYNSSGVSNIDSKFGFDNSVGMFNVSSQYGFTTSKGFAHNLQLYTAHTGIKNGWNNIVFEQDSGGTGFHVGDSVRDTSLSVSTQLYSLAWSMALPEKPLTFNGSFMANSGSRDFVRVLSWSGGANYVIIPGKLTVSSQLGFSSLHRPTDSETRSQLRFKYGASYRPTVNHTLRFDGSTLNGTGKPDFRNHFYYEFRF